MEIATSRLSPIASLRPLTVARCAQVPPEQVHRHHQYYNEVLAQIELLRAERYRLPPDPVAQATESQPVDSPKADLKPKPPSPSVRLQLNTGARPSSTRARQEININPSGMPGREGWLDEDWLYQKSAEDPLLLHILQRLS